MYNAKIQIIKENEQARVIRVFPDGPRLVYLPGQYGSLGLASPSKPEKLIKRPYSLSSSIVDLSTNSLIDYRDTNYYEIYFNTFHESASTEASSNQERLTPLLFQLKDGDRIFCGTKVTGYYTLKGVPADANVLLISSTTGESPSNGIVNQFLLENRSAKIAHILAGPPNWNSLYQAEQDWLVKNYKNYRFINNREVGYARTESMLLNLISDSDYSISTIGFTLRPDQTHVFLCGDPLMVGAPKKLGAWQYEFPENGLLRILNQSKFELRTKFKEGNVEYETYW